MTRTSKKAGKKAAPKRAAKKAAPAPAAGTNGKRRHFIQLDVSPELRSGVDKFLSEGGFTANRITVSDIGRVLFKALVKGVQVNVTDPASYYSAQAELSKGE